MDLRIASRLEAGRRSESYIYMKYIGDHRRRTTIILYASRNEFRA